jgi:hypothetical protein
VKQLNDGIVDTLVSVSVTGITEETPETPETDSLSG